jgi:hypothetical protein
MVPKRIGKNQNHRDDKTVNGDGFYHGQAHEQRSGNGRCRIGLLRQRTKRRGNGSALGEGWPDAAQAGGEARSDDGNDGNHGRVIHFNSCFK